MQKDGHENYPAEPIRYQEARGDRHAIKKSVDHQPQQHGGTNMVTADCLVVRLFPKMKMRRDGVLERMNQKIANEDHQERAVARQQVAASGDKPENGC